MIPNVPVDRSTPTDYADLFELERTRLLELLATIDQPDWSRPTPAPAWDVAGLCRHLLGDDLYLLSLLRDDHLGTEPPAVLDESEFIAWLDTLQEDWVHASRRISPSLVVELLGWLGPRLTDTLRRAQAADLPQHVSWADDQPVPMWLETARELTEYWIHRQQLLQALDRPEDLRTNLLGPVLDALRWAYPFRLRAVPGRPGDGVVVEVHGAVARQWTIVRDATAWDFSDRPADRVVARMRLDASTAWRLLTNNLAARHPQPEIDAEEPYATVLRDTRAIIGAPQAPH